MWERTWNVWRCKALPELEVRPCRMDDGTCWWACWFEDKPCPAVGASPSSEDVKAEAYEYFTRRVDL